MTRTSRPPTPASELTERDLEKHVITFARQMGWRVYKTWISLHSPAGWPDLSLYRARPDGTGELVFIELKREHGRNVKADPLKGRAAVVNGVTEMQAEWLAFLATVPGVRWCGVIRPSDWFSGVLDEILR